MRIISILNHKGGVGKTTTTLNLGAGLAREGKKVLLIDLDPQSNLSSSVEADFGVHTLYDTLISKVPLPIYPVAEHLDIVPASLTLAEAERRLVTDIKGYFKFKSALRKAELREKSYDFVLIDCPPSLGLLTMNALIASSEVLIPVQSQYLSVEGLDTVLSAIKELGESLEQTWKITGLLLTQTKHTNVSKTCVEGVQEQYPELVFETLIRENTALGEASLSKQDIFSYSPKSAGAEDYGALTLEVLKR